MSETTPKPVIDQRIPILDEENQFSKEAVSQQWALFTEAVRRSMLDRSDVRRVLQTFASQPVSQVMPYEFAQAVCAVDEKLARLFDRYQESLGAYLALDPVPEGQLKPDLRQTVILGKPESTMAMLERNYKDQPEEIAKRFQRYSDSGLFSIGITFEEFHLVAKRYAFARDIKLFALGAEILERGAKAVTNQKGEMVLPNGIRMMIDSAQEEVRSDLLQPHLWEKRKQLKDRVYVIEVGGRKYLLKEKKTDRHTDTKKNGHRDGRLSAEEFAIAHKFQTEATLEQGDYLLSWETPIGYATYPDGFQFVVFAFEEGLLANGTVVGQLAAEILSHQTQFEAEYHQIIALAQKYRNTSNVRLYDNGSRKTKWQLAVHLLGIGRNPPPEVTFEDFAKVKALWMMRRALDFMRETVIKLGYENSDADGFSYRIHPDAARVQLEIVGFDFEYYSKIYPDQIAKRLDSGREFNKDWETRNDIGFSQWNDETLVTSTQAAIYLALLEANNMLLEKLIRR